MTMQVGVSFEVEHVHPDAQEWDLIMRCVGSLPDNFAAQTGPMPPTYENSSLNGCLVARCRALSDATRDRFGRPRVDMVGLTFVDSANRRMFRPGERVALIRS